MGEENTNGDGSKTDESKSGEKNDPPKMVSASVADEYKQDLHRQKEANRELTERLNKLEDDKTTKETDTLKDKEQWKTLYEQKDEEAKTERGKREKLETAYLFDKKVSAVEKAALAAGMHKSAVDDLSMYDLDDKVIVETTDRGTMRVINADSFIANLKENKPFLFGTAAPPNVETGDPTVTTDSKVTIAQVLEAQNKGNNAEYQRLHTLYQKQQAG